ncbi:MAG TPA: hypothetical protein VE338_18120 [Ktedonobacterales bacterium]|jgi:hypothetical protein|nr:hypothetical protein [Ktedonobacterales bacterium]
MRRRRVALAALLLALLAGSAIYVSYGLRAYAHYRDAYAAYTTACDTLIAWTPPQTIYTGFYPNAPTLVTVRYRSPIPEATRLTVSIPGFTQQQTLESTSAQGFRTASFKPPLLSASTLDALARTERHDAQIRVQFIADSRMLCETSAPVTLISRQWIQWRDSATGADNTPLIAGWVTPDDPTITALVGHAAQRLIAHPGAYDNTPALYGYNQGAANGSQVRDQVDAIFDTLQFDYHLRYAADNVVFTHDASQQVQLPRDVLTSSAPTGMCVETTAILASAVERLGMRPSIIFTPTHAFLGVALGADPHAPVEYWETSDLNGGVDGAQANTHGDLEFTQDTQTHQIQEIVDIQYERAHGVTPME